MNTYLELDLDFPREVQEVKNNVHRFAKEVLRPGANALDRLADPQEVIAPGSVLWRVYKEAYRLGYHTAAIPTELGGLGLRGLGWHAMLEELGWGCAGFAISLVAACSPFSAVAATGNKELIDEFVKPFVEDREARLIGCAGVTEPQHGSDWIEAMASPQGPRGGATARREGDSYVVNGQKAAWVSNGTIATHGCVYLVSDPRGGMSGAGVVAFIPFNLPGVSKGRPLNKLGQRALNQGEIFFDNVRIPRRNLLVGPETFLAAGQASLTEANGMMSAVFTGVARAAFEAALDYSKERIQGGKPICEHQLVQKRLFEMFTKVEACRALSRASMVYNDRAAEPALEYASAAKIFCTQASFEVASDALQLFGGNGLSKEYPVEKIFRDARASLIEDGTNEVLSLTGAQLMLGRS